MQWPMQRIKADEALEDFGEGFVDAMGAGAEAIGDGAEDAVDYVGKENRWWRRRKRVRTQGSKSRAKSRMV